MERRLAQVLYSGLGGHGAVCFSLLEVASRPPWKHFLVFYGIEPVRSGYRDQCQALAVPYLDARKKPGLDLLSFGRILRWLWQVDPHAVLLHSPQLLPVCLLLKLRRPALRIIVVEHQANHMKGAKAWLMTRLSLVLADSVVYLSQAYRDQVAEVVGAKRVRGKAHVIPTGVNLSYFARPTLKPPGPPFVIGMQSRLTSNKDHETLLRAFALLERPELRLELAGDGETREHLESLARSLGVAERVHFRGMLDPPRLRDFLHGLDLYVHCSFGETMSTAILQAQAAGLPVVASSVNGIVNFLRQGEEALLVPPSDPPALAETLEKLIDDPRLRQRLAAAGSKMVARYTLSAMWRAYEPLLWATPW